MNCLLYKLTYFFGFRLPSVCVETVEYEVRTDDLDPTRDPIWDSCVCCVVTGAEGLTATNCGSRDGFMRDSARAFSRSCLDFDSNHSLHR